MTIAIDEEKISGIMTAVDDKTGETTIADEFKYAAAAQFSDDGQMMNL